MRRVLFFSAVFGLTTLAGCGEPTCSDADSIATYPDADGDGVGDADAPEPSCAGVIPAGRTLESGDCDDNEPLAVPGKLEECDGIDNNCDGVIDEGLGQGTYYADADGDGFGDAATAVTTCSPGPGYAANGDDCDDTQATANPDATEVCDGIDNNCDGLVDDDDPTTDPLTFTEWYADADGDGFGADGQSAGRCEGPPGSSDVPGDCNDNNPDINPNGLEVCSGFDEDCDGLIDDEDPDVDPLTQTEFFTDADLDGYGDANNLILACSAIPGAVNNSDDCDDTDPLVNLDTDWYEDLDGDGIGAGPSLGFQCLPPVIGAVPVGADCDDLNPAVYPGAPEICQDGIDQDCDGADNGCCDQLDTTYAGGNGLDGIMFNITALNAVEIDTFDISLDSNIVRDIEVYYKAGSWVGFHANAGAWTLAGTAPGVVSVGTGLPTPLPLALGIQIPAGQTYGIYVTTTAGGMDYTTGNNTDAVHSSNGDIEIKEGRGMSYPFSGGFEPRIFNGTVYYCF